MTDTSDQSAVRRIPRLTKERSGLFGENFVLTQLLRAGLNVAKPTWNDDEIDLLIVHKWDDGSPIDVIPLQVKTLQKRFTEVRSKKRPNILRYRHPIPSVGIPRKYIDRSAGFSLALVDYERRRWYLIPGRDHVRSVYLRQTRGFNDSKDVSWKWQFCAIPYNEEILFRMDRTDPALKRWKVSHNTLNANEQITSRILEVAKLLKGRRENVFSSLHDSDDSNIELGSEQEADEALRGGKEE